MNLSIQFPAPTYADPYVCMFNYKALRGSMRDKANLFMIPSPTCKKKELFSINNGALVLTKILYFYYWL